MPQLTIINRTGGGSRETFSDPTITFGREAGNMVVVAGTHTSRRHGELRFEDDRWQLVNLSPNGTEVNGRRVTTKPRPLNDRDVIGVGGEPLFDLRFDADAAVPQAAAPDEAPDGQRRMSRRTKLWLGISVYFVLFMGLFAFLNTLKSKDADNGTTARRLTHRQIEDEIRRPLKPMPEDLRQSQAELNQARELFPRLESAPDAVYKCYLAYKKSLALSGREHFDPGSDQLNYQDVRQRLIAEVTRVYDDAFLKLKDQRFADAVDAFRRLTQVYPDPLSAIHKNARTHKASAADSYGKRRRRRR